MQSVASVIMAGPLHSASVSPAHTAIMAMQDSFLSHLISALSLLPYSVTDMIWLLFNIVYLYVSTNNNMGHGVAKKKIDNCVVTLTGFQWTQSDFLLLHRLHTELSNILG
jgi:hypothetical protein